MISWIIYFINLIYLDITDTVYIHNESFLDEFTVFRSKVHCLIQYPYMQPIRISKSLPVSPEMEMYDQIKKMTQLVHVLNFRSGLV